MESMRRARQTMRLSMMIAIAIAAAKPVEETRPNWEVLQSTKLKYAAPEPMWNQE
jgi:CelD/BcsL family acetyltransferase involved in cellulose biosynthesis